MLACMTCMWFDVVSLTCACHAMLDCGRQVCCNVEEMFGTLNVGVAMQDCGFPIAGGCKMFVFSWVWERASFLR